jgi:hypothetical protein
MRYAIVCLTVFEFFFASASWGAKSRPVHLFIVRSTLVRNFFSTLGQGWATKMKIRLYKEVLPGQFGDVDEVFVPVIDDGTSRLTSFEQEFPETQSHLEAIALKNPASYLVWDTTDKSIGAFRLDIPSVEATSSIYAKDEVDAAVVNSQILFSAVQNEFPEIKMLNDGPLKYSYLLRPFSADDVTLAAIHPLNELLNSNIDLSWRHHYLEALGKIVAVLNYRFGIYPSLNPQSVDLALNPNTNEIRNFIVRGSKNITVDNFIRMAQKLSPLHTGKRTPQINRFHYYYPALSQPGENIATFTSQSILIPGVDKTVALRFFLKAYVKTVKEITGVQTNISDRKPATDTKWSPNDVQGFLSTALQSIYNQVIEAKRPFVTDFPVGDLSQLQTEFKRRYEASDVAILDYYHNSYFGFHNWELACKQFSNQLGFTFNAESKSIFAYEKKTGKVLAIAYDVKQDNRFLEALNKERSTLRDLWTRYLLAVKLLLY